MKHQLEIKESDSFGDELLLTVRGNNELSVIVGPPNCIGESIVLKPDQVGVILKFLKKNYKFKRGKK
jgi:hypothetical protein